MWWLCRCLTEGCKAIKKVQRGLDAGRDVADVVRPAALIQALHVFKAEFRDNTPSELKSPDIMQDQIGKIHTDALHVIAQMAKEE